MVQRVYLSLCGMVCLCCSFCVRSGVGVYVRGSEVFLLWRVVLAGVVGGWFVVRW